MRLELNYDLDAYRQRAEDGVNAAAAKALGVAPAQQAIYDAKYRAAVSLADDDLLREEAKLRGCSVAELRRRIVAARQRQLEHQRRVELARVEAIQAIRQADSPARCMALLKGFRTESGAEKTP